MNRLLVVCALLLGGCTGFTPEYAETYDAPIRYLTWWDEVKECAPEPFHGPPFGNITWYSVPSDPSVVGAVGFYSPDSGRIIGGLTRGTDVYIADHLIYHWPTVKHEMLHVIGWIHDNSTDYPWPFRGCTEHTALEA